MPTRPEFRVRIEDFEKRNRNSQRRTAVKMIEQDDPQLQMLEVRLVTDQPHLRVGQELLHVRPVPVASATLEIFLTHGANVRSDSRKLNREPAVPCPG